MGEGTFTPSDAIEPIGSANQAGAGQANLTDLASDAAKEVIAAGNLSDAMEGAMSGILEMPGRDVETLNFKDTLTGAADDNVTREKTGLMSESAADGKAESAEDSLEPLMARYEKLYADMTVFQVAWSIARRVQQDTSQLLRGQ